MPASLWFYSPAPAPGLQARCVPSVPGRNPGWRAPSLGSLPAGAPLIRVDTPGVATGRPAAPSSHPGEPASTITKAEFTWSYYLIIWIPCETDHSEMSDVDLFYITHCMKTLSCKCFLQSLFIKIFSLFLHVVANIMSQLRTSGHELGVHLLVFHPAYICCFLAPFCSYKGHNRGIWEGDIKCRTVDNCGRFITWNLQ